MSYSFKYLRNTFNQFTYQSYYFKQDESLVTVNYHFHIDNKIHFHPKFSFSSKNIEHKLNSIEFSIILFQIGLLEAISYWKTTCCRKFFVKPYQLTKFQSSWLEKLFYLGLGEFRYINNIEVSKEEFVAITSSQNQSPEIKFRTKANNLIPLGGGKDSLVTLNLKKDFPNKIFLLNPRKASLDICKSYKLEDDTFIINRYLDKTMLELNAKGYLNGHTPFSALLSFYSLLAAYLLECNSIVLSIRL